MVSSPIITKGPSHPIGSVLVGIDGSSAASAALDWAHLLAGPGTGVNTIHVVDENDADPGGRAEAEWFAPATCHHHVRTAGNRLDEIMAHATNMDADLVLIGRHTPSRASLRRVGRLAAGLIRRTSRPIGIVPEGCGASLDRSSRILVVVDHGRAHGPSLRWAAELASTHGTELSLFTAVPNRPPLHPDRPLDTLAYYVDRDLVRQWAREDLDAFAVEIQAATDRDLTIATSAAGGSKRTLTVKRSGDAALLVIGLQRGRHSATNGIPLSLHHTLTHAPCPVVLIPEDDRKPTPEA